MVFTLNLNVLYFSGVRRLSSFLFLGLFSKMNKPDKNRVERSARWAQGTGSDVCGGACPAPQTGTGAKKKGASPQQYVESPKGKPAGRRLVVATDHRLPQKRS
jgi:hypothetical protein